MNPIVSLVKGIFNFYYDGFRSMSWWGRRVWVIIIIKLLVIFVVLKLFFFQDFLGRRYNNDEQKSEYILNQLIKSK